MNTRALAVVGLAALCTMASPLAAQAPANLPSTFCLRGQPLRACRSYLVFELTGAAQLTSTAHEFSPFSGAPVLSEEDLRSYVAWNVGRMVNRDSTHALGVVLQGGFASEGVRVAIQGRRRTWLPNNDHFDLAAGILSVPQMTSRGSVQAYGLTAESAFGFGDQVSIVVSGDLVRSRQRGSAALQVGARFGSYTAMAATGLIAAAVAVIASTIQSID